MFGSLGTGEIIILLVIALIVIGPKKLPEVARTIGRGLAELRRASYDLQRTLSLDELDNMVSRLPDADAKARLHEKTAAKALEVSGTPGRSTGEAPSPHPDDGTETSGNENGLPDDNSKETTAPPSATSERAPNVPGTDNVRMEVNRTSEGSLTAPTSANGPVPHAANSEPTGEEGEER